MKRIGWLVMATVVVAAGFPMRVLAKRLPKAVAMEMVMMIPLHHHLAIYEQWVFSHPPKEVMMGILPDATHLRGVGAHIDSRAPHDVIITAQENTCAVRYQVPWNGRSGAYMLPSYGNTGAVVLLVPPSLAMPAVLNPSLVFNGQGRIPLSKKVLSPVFNEYVTSHLMAGSDLPLIVEQDVNQNSPPSTLFAGHLYPRIGQGFQVAIAVLSAMAILLALYWRKLFGLNIQSEQNEAVANFHTEWHPRVVDDASTPGHMRQGQDHTRLLRKGTRKP